ncbi:MAG: fimbrillin family protein [Prevotella sp.]|nr:fimbrillin family protein [Prevotella sp.]
MKKIFLFGTMMAAMTLASCSSSDDGQQAADSGKAPVLATKTAIGFDAYTGRAVTRAGTTGVLDLTALQTVSTGGFGVFAYYTDLKKYDQTYVPNFMYNTHVSYDGTSAWTYSPVMYWPNEYGSDAQSDDEDKVSFFAYAPWVETGSAAAGSVSGDATWGITGFSRNTNAGDPMVKYIASFDPAKSVDLCWGVVGDSEAEWGKIQGNTNQTLTVGKPWLDVEHPKGVDQKLKFTFKHALAKLNVQIDADIDNATHGAGSEVAAETKIYVRSISFTGIAMKGSLNLNNATAGVAQWLDYSGSTDLPYGESITVKDQRRDGREGGSGAEATNELPGGLNPAIIQTDAVTPGVVKTAVNLFKPVSTIADPENPTAGEIAAQLADAVYVIPTGEAMTVTIVYDVETTNEDLPTYISNGTTHGSSIENRISKQITFTPAGGLVSGNTYTVKLHLGMNTVKYEAAVTGWEGEAINGEGWLPSNTPVEP